MLEGGVKWSGEGRKGGALHFEGTDGFVRLPDNIAKQLDTMTIALWVKLDANPMWARVFDLSGSKGFILDAELRRSCRGIHGFRSMLGILTQSLSCRSLQTPLS